MKSAEEAARIMAMECPASAVRQMSRALSSIFDAELRPLGLQLSQLPVLSAAAMVGERGIAMGALARGLVMDATTLTRNLRPLARAGLIRTARDPGDARARLIFLTPQGERVLESAFPAWRRARAKAETLFGAKTLASLRDQMGSILQAVGGFAATPVVPTRRRARRSRPA